MRKLILAFIVITSVSIDSIGQSKKSIFIDTIFHPKSKEQQKHEASQKRIGDDGDSTISKANNGFDVKKSKHDNMLYLNANESNPSIHQMPNGSINNENFTMPIRKLPNFDKRLSKDTSFKIYFHSDSLKKWQKH